MGAITLIPKGRHGDVATRFGPGAHVDQVKGAQAVDQRRMAGLGDAAQLDVGAGRQVDQPIAMGAGKIGDACGLFLAQASATGADTDDIAIAGTHGAKRTWAPAFDFGAAHNPASSVAAIELRRVIHRPASRNAAKRSLSAASAAGLSRSMNATTSARPKVASW